MRQSQGLPCHKTRTGSVSTDTKYHVRSASPRFTYTYTDVTAVAYFHTLKLSFSFLPHIFHSIWAFTITDYVFVIGSRTYPTEPSDVPLRVVLCRQSLKLGIGIMNPDSFYRSLNGGIVNLKTIRFLFLLRFFWPTLPESIPEKGQKQPRNRNCDSFGIGIETALVKSDE